MRAWLAFGMWLGAVVARADLVFDAVEVAHQAAVGEKAFEAVFPFENTGATPVTLTQVVTTCGCTAPQFVSRAYQPGERGEVRAVFTYGGRTGTQVKRVTVMTAERPAPYELTLRVELPQPLMVEPRVLTFRKDDPNVTRTVKVRFGEGFGADFGSLEIEGAGITAEMRAEEAPGKYRLEVTVDAAVARHGQVVIVPTGGGERVPVFVRVR